MNYGLTQFGESGKDANGSPIALVSFCTFLFVNRSNVSNLPSLGVDSYPENQVQEISNRGGDFGAKSMV